MSASGLLFYASLSAADAGSTQLALSRANVHEGNRVMQGPPAEQLAIRAGTVVAATLIDRKLPPKPRKIVRIIAGVGMGIVVGRNLVIYHRQPARTERNAP